MRAGFATALIVCLMPVTAFATTLRLATEIDLLILDGKKVSSSLLRGAGSIELENGPHQLVFRVEKSIRMANREQRMWISPPLIVSFNTRSIDLVNVTLPRLETQRESEMFDASPQISLLDGHAVSIPARVDILPVTETPDGIDYERDTERYNKQGHHASLPQFANKMADDSTLLSSVSELDVPPSQDLTEQRLKYWYQQADPQTRSRFMEWVKLQPPS